MSEHEEYVAEMRRRTRADKAERDRKLTMAGPIGQRLERIKESEEAADAVAETISGAEHPEAVAKEFLEKLVEAAGDTGYAAMGSKLAKALLDVLLLQGARAKTMSGAWEEAERLLELSFRALAGAATAQGMAAVVAAQEQAEDALAEVRKVKGENYGKA